MFILEDDHFGRILIRANGNTAHSFKQVASSYVNLYYFL